MKIVRSFYFRNAKKNRDVFRYLKFGCIIGKRLYNTMMDYYSRYYECYDEFPSQSELMYMLRNATEPYNHFKQMQKMFNGHAVDYSNQMYFGAIQSYWALRKKEGCYANMPKYTDKEFFATGYCKFDNNGWIYLSPLRNKELKIKIPRDQFEGIKWENEKGLIRQVRFALVNDDIIRVEVIYDKEPIECSGHGILGIDLGVNNIMACASDMIDPFVISGGRFKSVNQFYNKIIAEKSSELQKNHKKYTSKSTERILFWRNNKIKHLSHILTTYIINICKTNGISTIVIGSNKNQKKNMDIGKIGTQNFQCIPYWKIREMLKYKCKLNGIEYIETEESYTSKTDHLAFEKLNEYGFKDENFRFIGKRIYRGLFLSSTGKVLNADVNGAIGILRKKFGDAIVPKIKNPTQASRKDPFRAE